MELIYDRSNMKRAMKHVIQNKGAAGVDGMTVHKIKRYLKKHWSKIKRALLEGVYNPMPVRRKEIPKPGGFRLLGIPTVLDRVIQQAVAQVLNLIWDPIFSKYSFGFRPDLLKVNREKSAVGRPWERKYLGFCVTNSRKNPKIRIHWKTIKRFRERVREITARRRGRSVNQVIDELNMYMRGWWGYFRLTESFNRLRPLQHWIRRRIRALIWSNLSFLQGRI